MRAKRKQRSTKSTGKEPLLGIFWLVNGKLVIDGVPLAEAEPCGSKITHPADHVDLWEVWKRSGRAPQFANYEEYPRGRTIHTLASGEVTIYADKCILQRKDIVKEIKEVLHLPKKITLDTDEHYRCHKCLYGALEEADDE